LASSENTNKSFKKEDSVLKLPEFNNLGQYKMTEDETETQEEVAPEEPASTESDDSEVEASDDAEEEPAEEVKEESDDSEDEE
jgi:hypothetical protein